MNVFITGGSRGIGRSIVSKFAQNGCKVFFTYNSSELEAIEVANGYPDILGYKCDIKDYEQCKEVARNVLDKCGNIDVLINNAGIMIDKTFLKMDRSIWEEVIDVNLKSIFYFTHEFAHGMAERKFGRIINLSSVAGQQGAFGKTNYAAAKAGVIGFTKALALELASKNITVNAIAPGMIQTDMIKSIPDHYLEDIKQSIPSRHIGKVEDISEMVYYLSGDGGKYITGQVIGINGGMYL